MAITNEDWSTVLFGFSYIHHLERSSEASVSEINRLDSIRLFMVALHVTDSTKLTEARLVRTELESKVEASDGEIKRQKRAKVFGIIGGVLSGFGAGSIFGWAMSR